MLALAPASAVTAAGPFTIKGITMYLKTNHGKRASELLAFAEQEVEGDLRCLGRSVRYDEDDRDHWEWLRIENWNGNVHVSVYGWGSAFGQAAERLADLIEHPEHWHMGKQPFDPQNRLYGDFEPITESVA